MVDVKEKLGFNIFLNNLNLKLSIIVLTDYILLLFFGGFFGVPYSATLIIFVIFVHSVYVQCRGSNPRPLDREPSALTTRPWLWLSPMQIFGVFF